MTHRTPPRGRCFTPTAVHQFSARQLPARTPTLPLAEPTEPDELLPACVDRSPPAEQALHDTRLDGARYRTFARRLSEEVVLHASDQRLEPLPKARKA